MAGKKDDFGTLESIIKVEPERFQEVIHQAYRQSADEILRLEANM